MSPEAPAATGATRRTPGNTPDFGRFRAELYLVGMTVIWGGTYVATKIALGEAGPFLIVAVRFAVSAVLFAYYARGVTRQIAGHGAVLGLLAFLAFALQTVGLVYTTTARSAFLTGLFVFFTPFFYWLLKRRRPSQGTAVALPIVFVGLFLLASPEGAPANIGDLLSAASAIAFSLHIVALDDFTRRNDFRRLMSVQFAATAVLSLAPAAAFESLWPALSLRALFAIFYLTIIATFGLFYVQMRYQKETTPVRAAVIYSLEPVFAAIFAFALLREGMGLREIVGGALLLCGVLVAELWGVAFRPRS